MATTVEDLEIFVIAENQTGANGVDFELAQSPDAKKNYLKDGVIRTNKNEINVIKFVLADSTRRLLKFESAPIHIEAGKNCPPKSGVGGGFNVTDISNNSFMLHCPSTNKKDDFTYQLNIVSELEGGLPKVTKYPYDPVIENGGGQGFEQAWGSLIAGLFGLILGAGLTYLAAFMGWIHFNR